MLLEPFVYSSLLIMVALAAPCLINFIFKLGERHVRRDYLIH